MNSNDIKDVIKSSHIFQNLQVTCRENVATTNSKVPLIFNTIKCKEGLGEHWVLCCLDKHGIPVYYDSFGKDIPSEVIHYFHTNIVKTITRPTQQSNTYECGQMCLYAFVVLKRFGLKELNRRLTSNRQFNTLVSKYFVKAINGFTINQDAKAIGRKSFSQAVAK